MQPGDGHGRQEMRFILKAVVKSCFFRCNGYTARLPLVARLMSFLLDKWISLPNWAICTQSVLLTIEFDILVGELPDFPAKGG